MPQNRDKDPTGNGFKIKKPLPALNEYVVIQKNILGHLGHMMSTHAQETPNGHVNDENRENNEEDFI